jgi:hypothetical protein
MSITKIVLVSGAALVSSTVLVAVGYFKGKVDGKREVLNGPIMNKLESVLHGTTERSEVQHAATA